LFQLSNYTTSHQSNQLKWKNGHNSYSALIEEYFPLLLFEHFCSFGVWFVQWKKICSFLDLFTVFSHKQSIVISRCLFFFNLWSFHHVLSLSYCQEMYNLADRISLQVANLDAIVESLNNAGYITKKGSSMYQVSSCFQ
jgi:hypothetical protein